MQDYLIRAIPTLFPKIIAHTRFYKYNNGNLFDEK